jgi:uncharacterized coiled-coil protein SlyX
MQRVLSILAVVVAVAAFLLALRGAMQGDNTTVLTPEASADQVQQSLLRELEGTLAARNKRVKEMSAQMERIRARLTEVRDGQRVVPEAMREVTRQIVRYGAFKYMQGLTATEMDKVIRNLGRMATNGRARRPQRPRAQRLLPQRPRARTARTTPAQAPMPTQPQAGIITQVDPRAPKKVAVKSGAFTSGGSDGSVPLRLTMGPSDLRVRYWAHRLEQEAGIPAPASTAVAALLTAEAIACKAALRRGVQGLELAERRNELRRETDSKARGYLAGADATRYQAWRAELRNSVN